jgi:hypothetical protein
VGKGGREEEEEEEEEEEVDEMRCERSILLLHLLQYLTTKEMNE